ncbi:MAG: type IV secretory system conjugative DNA transfer family protein, partial [Bacilli bacterium]|nr:type IV secretory system conjugative DNA transfer family protein [Bacilli bacterium]
MKFKFKATEKDIIKYVLGALLFLYVVAIGVLNLSYFSKYSIFYGFNPIEAFFPEYIVYTITFFIAGIVLVAISVTSHFFEREKGFGFKKTDKKSDGYETWANEKEIKSAIGMKSVNPSSESYSGGGVPLIVKEDELWVDDGESHSLIVGATGSGKTSCMVQPLVNILAKHGESMIITDPKGEIYRKNYEYLKAKNYNIVVLNFREPQKGNAWNPLTLPYDLYKSGNSDKSNELLRDLAINILSDEKTDDPFWQNTAADFFTGLA